MLTLKQIIAKTPSNRIEGARYVKPLRVQSGYNEDGQAFIAAQTYSTHEWSPTLHTWVRSQNRPKYVTMITFLDKKLHCKVSCSCADFMFRSEFALHSKGAADIEYSDGSPPDFTNPQLRPQTCKHVVRLYFMIQDKLKR